MSSIYTFIICIQFYIDKYIVFSNKQASGIIASRNQRGVLWSHNDHGDDARIFAFSEEGADLGTVYIHLLQFDNSSSVCKEHFTVRNVGP